MSVGGPREDHFFNAFLHRQIISAIHHTGAKRPMILFGGMKMFCSKCGSKCEDGAPFCGACGAPLTDAPAPEQAAPQYTAPVQPTAQQSAAQQGAPQQYPPQYAQPSQPYPPQYPPQGQYAPQGAPQYAQQYAPPAYQQQPTGGFYAVPEQPAKKKSGKKKGIIATVSIIVALALIAGAIFLIPKLLGSGGSFQKIENEEVKTLSNGLRSVYTAIIPKNDGSTTTTDLNIKLDSSVLDLLSSAGDFGFLSDIGISLDRASDGNDSAVAFAVSLGGKTIANVDARYDKESEMVYVKVAELSDKYIAISSTTLGEMIASMSSGLGGIGGDDYYDYDSYTGSSANYKNIGIFDGFDFDGSSGVGGAAGAALSALPDEDALTSLIERYGKIVVDSIENVEDKEVTLELDGLSQECTAYVVNFDTEQFKKTVRAVLDEAKGDDELRSIISDVTAAMSDNGMDMGERIDSEEEYVKAIESIEKSLDQIGTEGSEGALDGLIDYTLYTDSDGNVIGRDLSVNGNGGGEQTFSLTSRAVTDGDDLAFNVKLSVGSFIREIDSSFELSGKGTGTLDSYTGNAVLTANVQGEEMELILADLTDFNINQNKEGKLNGKISASLGEDLIDKIASSMNGSYDGMMNSSIMSILKQVKFNMEFDHNGDDLTVKGSISALGQNFLNIDCTNGAGTRSLDLDVPSTRDVVEAGDDGEGFSEWISDWDVSGFIDGLEDAGVPEEMCEQLEGMLGVIASGELPIGIDDPDY